jgi:uncharacterized protein DUF4136
MRQRGLGIGLALLALGAAACAPVTVSSHVLPSADFARYRTFDWGPADALPTSDARLERDAFFQDHVQGAVEHGLAARGFARVSTGTPDLLIHYHANVTQRIDINRLGDDRGSCYDNDCRVRVVEVEAGTLVLDVIDARTNQLVWRGWAQNNLQNTIRSRDRMERQIDEVVSRMLARLPAGSAFHAHPVPAETGAQ